MLSWETAACLLSMHSANDAVKKKKDQIDQTLPLQWPSDYLWIPLRTKGNRVDIVPKTQQAPHSLTAHTELTTSSTFKGRDLDYKNQT